jgi:hypothetical protein
MLPPILSILENFLSDQAIYIGFDDPKTVTLRGSS